MANPMEKVKVDLEATQSYLAKTSAVGGATAVVDQQCESWAQRLACMKMDPQEGSALVDVLASGPWTEAQKAKLMASINGAILSGGKLHGTRRQLQSCDNFKPFLSTEDVKTLGNPHGGMVAKIDTICTRMLRIGLHCPAETCWQKVVSVGQQIGLGFPTTPKELNDGLKELKRVLKSKVKMVEKPGVHLVNFPQVPLELPKEILDKAYDDHDPPCGLDTAVADLQTVPLRMSNKLIRGESQHQLVPHGGTSQDPMNQWMQFMMMQQQVFMRQAMGQTQKADDPVDLPGFQLFKPNNQQRPSPKVETTIAVPEKPKEAAPAQTQDPELKTPPSRSCLSLPEVTPPLTDQDLSAAEQAAMVGDALEARKATKPAKAKAKAKTKAKAKPKAKAKGKATAVTKSTVQKKVDVKTTKPLLPFKVNGKTLTPEFRMKQKPHGCGKCRNRPGCTPSCWKDRKF